MLGILIVVIVLVAVVAWLITIYNRLILLKNRFQNAFAQIDVQLKRRHDLIPNLVETAKGYLKHERETMQEVIEARNAAVKGLSELKGSLNNPDLMQAFATAEQNLHHIWAGF